MISTSTDCYLDHVFDGIPRACGSRGNILRDKSSLQGME
jgi:hypothetical protein